MATTEKIKLVIVNENTLGCIWPEYPNTLHVIQASGTRGSFMRNMENYSIKNTPVRLASEKDFEEYRVCFEGFNNTNEYEYAI